MSYTTAQAQRSKASTRKNDKERIQSATERETHDEQLAACGWKESAVLVEANVVGVFSKAAAADIQAVLADDADTRPTDAARTGSLSIPLRMRAPDVFVTHLNVLRRATTKAQWCASGK
ncbi:40S ribosomal protein S29 [Gracilaria domingensis]|nr:40S ribosomal protein S29 [Gracilaria domingensis]